MEPNQRINLTLEGMGRLGEAMAKVEDKPVFVLGGIPGEEVVAKVIREHRHYISAEVVEVIVRSPYRVEAPCSYFGKCTGCQWQHIDYTHQLELKRQAMAEALERVGHFSNVSVLPTLPSPQSYGYRNHARFTIGPEGRLGFVHRERRQFVDIDTCLLMDPKINMTLSKLQGRCSETTQLSVRCGINSESWLVQPILKNHEIPFASGQKHYYEKVEEATFRVAASSFFQVNTKQVSNITELVRQSLRLSGQEVVVDAYAGVGTFSALLSPYARRIIAIEESASAIQDATENLSTYANIVIQKGKTEQVLGDLKDSIDGVILDPPRAGCERKAIDSLIQLAPSRISYISCDPATLARDLRVLVDGPYRIESVQPIDMFPQTHHVECVTTLTLKAGHPIILGSASPRRHQILSEARIPFTVTSPNIDEIATVEEPEAYVEEIALTKARHVASTLSKGLVLAADTEVVIDGAVLGKPRDRAHAFSMLQTLRGKHHQVFTGVAVINTLSGESVSAVEISNVTMRLYSDEEAQCFVDSGESYDKSGAYSIQNSNFQPVTFVDGCYLNVVGLPLCLVVKLLHGMGAEVGTPNIPNECKDCPLRKGYL